MGFSLNPTPSPPPPAAPPKAVAALRKISFHAMGTRCEVQYVAPQGDAQARGFELATTNWVQAFEAKYSRYQPTSLVSRINAAAGRAWVEIDEEMAQMLALGDALFHMTSGVLDPTALPLIQLWNWKAEKPVVPTPEQVAAAKRLVGWRKVQRAPGKVLLPDPGMALDFGGFGKEYAVDIVAQLALDRGITDVLVDFGHDLRALGRPPGRPAWHIGLEDPKHPERCDGSLGISGKGVASSGDYIRFFSADGKRYGHIIDPRTGYPVSNGCEQVTVIAGTCLQAGVLSTACFVLGVRAGLDLIQSCPGAEGLIVTAQARAQTRGFFTYVAS